MCTVYYRAVQERGICKGAPAPPQSYAYVLCTFLAIGDHIRVYRTLYYHHMLVVKVIDRENLLVIHYTGPEKAHYCEDQELAAAVSTASSFLIAPTDRTAPKAKVIEGIFTINPSSKFLELLEYEPGVAVNTGHKAVTRARTRLDEEEYNLLFKNCESFVNWAITTREETNQGEIGTAGIILGGLALLGVGVGAAAYYASSRRGEEREGERRGRRS